MRLMFLRVLGWLGDTWRTLYLNGRQRNHRLVGFYRYHLDTMRAKISPWLQKLKGVLKTPKFHATLRTLVFWPLMGVAAFIIYTEQVPLFNPSIGTHPGQGGLSQVGSQTPLELQADNTPAQFNALQPFSFCTMPETTQSTGANSLAATDTLDTTNSDPSMQVPQPPATKEDEVTAVLASLPRFEIATMTQPVQGEVVRPIGWYRHEVYGDWRMASGLTIEPARPGDAVQAAYTGIVDQVTKVEADTWSVRLIHQDGWETEYSGLEQITAEPGSVIKQGEVLGVTANNAQATLSFSLKHQDEPIDTIEYWH